MISTVYSNTITDLPSSGGGKPISQNRTLWPVTGGAVGVQPGWLRGHSNAFMYINLGDGTIPDNYSLPMQTVFEIVGPSNELYNGSICLPQVPLPVNYTAKVGNNATIQVIEAAQHGAALYNVSFLLKTLSFTIIFCVLDRMLPICMLSAAPWILRVLY